MNPFQQYQCDLTRRHFFGRCATGLGAAALTSLMAPDAGARPASVDGTTQPTKIAPRAKNVIYLFMSGGPSHVDTLDYKPALERYDGQPIPPSVIKDVHFAQITRLNQQPLLRASPFGFRPCGDNGTMVSDLLPHTASVIDRLAVVRSMHSPIFNHDPAVWFLNSGDSRVGRPTVGSWLSYGLGSENRDLPAFVVMSSGIQIQPLLDSYWGSGFLPTQHQGVRLRSEGEPVLFLSNPKGINRAARREQIEAINWMNRQHHQEFRDPEILAHIERYELAFRMQAATPDLVDVTQETQETMDLYGAKIGQNSFAKNCLLARRMVERGVRFVQLYHMGWDSHNSLVHDHRRQCSAIDRGAAALILDLERRGLLDETLVVWGGEFGRTPVVEGGGSNWGRDHHPHGFTMWMAGGGIRPGISYGSTDEFGFHATEKKMDVHDFHATLLHCLGIDHTKLTYRHQGRDFRLTDVSGRVITDLLA